MTFLSSRPATSPEVVIVGVPFDATSTFRAGSGHGPDAIRWASQSIETYSPVLRRDLERVAVTDLGDVDTTGLTPERVVDAVRDRLLALDPAAVPLVLGGEHTVTLGAVQALHRRHPSLVVMQLDAHTDLRDAYEGRAVSHATVVRRVLDVLEAGSVVQLGVRAGTAEEFDAARALRFSGPRIALPADVWAWMEPRPVYVTLDIDVLDPSDAPGTGNPEPDGVRAPELLAFVRRLGLLNVVGLDVVEVSPPHDPTGRTAVLAATIIREAILAIKGTSDSPPTGSREQGNAGTRT